jgi:hypothetical protein
VRHFDDWANVLFDQAVLAEGGQLDDPATFVKRVNQLMLEMARTRLERRAPPARELRAPAHAARRAGLAMRIRSHLLLAAGAMLPVLAFAVLISAFWSGRTTRRSSVVRATVRAR